MPNQTILDITNTTAGIDEVGRGSLAGPVFLGMVLLPTHYPLYTASYNTVQWTKKYDLFRIVRDSKKLSLTARKVIFNTVNSIGLEYYLLSASAKLIDNYGIGVCLSHMVLLHTNLAKNSRMIIDGKIKILTQYNQKLLSQLQQENNLNMPIVTFPCLNDPLENQKTVERENKADDK